MITVENIIASFASEAEAVTFCVENLMTGVVIEFALNEWHVIEAV